MGGLLALTGMSPEGALGGRCLLVLLLLLLSLPNCILCLQELQDAPVGAALDAAEDVIIRATSGVETQPRVVVPPSPAPAAATATPSVSEPTASAQKNTNNVSSSTNSNKNKNSSKNSSRRNNSNSSNTRDRFADAAPPLGFREPLSLLPQKSEAVFKKLAACADTDPRRVNAEL